MRQEQLSGLVVVSINAELAQTQLNDLISKFEARKCRRAHLWMLLQLLKSACSVKYRVYCLCSLCVFSFVFLYLYLSVTTTETLKMNLFCVTNSTFLFVF